MRLRPDDGEPVPYGCVVVTIYPTAPNAIPEPEPPEPDPEHERRLREIEASLITPEPEND